jgi:hypothetical protein
VRSSRYSEGQLAVFRPRVVRGHPLARVSGVQVRGLGRLVEEVEGRNEGNARARALWLRAIRTTASQCGLERQCITAK